MTGVVLEGNAAILPKFEAPEPRILELERAILDAMQSSVVVHSGLP